MIWIMLIYSFSGQVVSADVYEYGKTYIQVGKIRFKIPILESV